MDQAFCGQIKGKVQGVFFRVSIQRKACELGLTGWCRNTFEGHVEILIAGKVTGLRPMCDWLNIGPQLARVDLAELNLCENPGLKSFEIRH